MGSNIIEPKICMKRDIDAVNYVIDRISTAEPSAIIGMADLGKDMIYSTLLKKKRNINTLSGLSMP